MATRRASSREQGAKRARGSGGTGAKRRAAVPKRTPAPRAEDASTRDHMLDVALEAFAELGYDGASTRTIASRAGVNQGLIPYYFGTKEKLWREAVDRAFIDLRAGLDLAQAEAANAPVGQAAAERAEQLIRRFVGFAARRPAFVRLMSDEGKRDGPRMRWIVDRHVRPMFEATSALAAASAKAGILPQAVGAAHYFYILVGAITQLFHQGPEFRRLTGADPTAPAIVEAHADALVALFIRPEEN